MVFNPNYSLKINLLQIILILTLVIPKSEAEPDAISLSDAKALYTFEIAKQVIWPNEKELKEFRVGLIGASSRLHEAFEKRSSFEVRGKTFQFDILKDTDFPKDKYSIVFIAQKRRSFNNLLFSKLVNGLIITEGKVDHEQKMLALITEGDSMKVELNLTNLTNKGFEVSTNLLELAGTKEDLSAQLREKEARLNSLFSEVKSKQANLNQLNQVLETNRKLLNKAKLELEENKKALNENEMKLKTLVIQIDKDQLEVQKNKQEIEQQKRLILDKQSEIAAQEKSMNALVKRIEENRQILKQQLTLLKKQDNVIEDKDATISLQRWWMIVILIISVVFFVLIYFLFRANRLRQKVNQELESLNAQLYELATTDGMTKLFNRRYFLEIAQIELNRQKRNKFQSVMLMLDIDNFKNINDTFGHAVGDEVIISVANSLRTHMREYDIVGRFGGEEYTMMLIDCDIEKAQEIAGRLCKHIANTPITFRDIVLNVTVSIGLSQLDTDDLNVEQTIMRSDKALYQAKENGKNQVSIYSKPPSLN